MNFMMILNDPDMARYVCTDPRIDPFVDLETLGKAERQGHMSSWKSKQNSSDVTRIRDAVPEAHLIVRINPLHNGSPAEIDDVIARGADSVMLPMFHDYDTLARFLDLLDDRAQPLPLFETAKSVADIPSIVPKTGLTRLHIGMNDLHLDLGHDFLFQPLVEGYLEDPTLALRDAGIRFGIGGIARAREGIVSPEFLLGEHVRLGSDNTILSQTFHRNAQDLVELKEGMDFPQEIQKLHDIYTTFTQASPQALIDNKHATHDKIRDVIQLIRTRKEAQ